MPIAISRKRFTADDYQRMGQVGILDILLIVEIADSSIDYDQDVKARIYAGAGVPEYWLADLNANLVSCYSAPHEGTYRNRQQHRRGQTITPQMLPQCAVAVDLLLRE